MSTKTATRKFQSYAWRYLLCFSLLYCTMYCAKLNLPNAAASLIAELSITRADIGLIMGLLFWGYGLGQLVNGRASEVFGAKRFLVTSALLTFTVNVAMCLTTNVMAMALLWGINGFVQSMAWTPGVSLLANWWGAKRRGFAVGFAVAFASFGQVLVTLTVAASFILFPQGGYRAALLFPASLPLLALCLFLICAKATPEEAGLRPLSVAESDLNGREAAMRKIVAQKGVLYPYKYIFTSPGFVLWATIAFAMGLVRYGLITWVPLFMINTFGASMTTGLIHSVALPVGMAAGTLIVPALTDRFCPENRLPAALLSALTAAVALFLLATFEKNDATLLLTDAFLFFIGFFAHAVNGTVTTYATDIGGRVFTATALGTLDFMHYLGAIAQSFLFGALLEDTLEPTLFLTLGVTCLMVTLLGWIAREKTMRRKP